MHDEQQDGFLVFNENGDERTAGEAGIVVLRLETNRTLSEAIALYKGSGYVEVKAFNAESYAHHWFEKTLGKKTQTGRVQ